MSMELTGAFPPAVEASHRQYDQYCKSHEIPGLEFGLLMDEKEKLAADLTARIAVVKTDKTVLRKTRREMATYLEWRRRLCIVEPEELARLMHEAGFREISRKGF